MAEIPIGDQHQTPLARMQHVGEWLNTEQHRLENELLHVMQQAQRHAAETTAFLQRAYGLDANTTPVTLDTERGVLVTPDEQPTESSAEPPE